MQPANPTESAELAKVAQQVAERSSRILGDFVQKQTASLSAAMRDELGVAKAFMDLYARLAASPALLASVSMNLWMDQMRLWQSSWMKLFGMPSPPVAEPAKGDYRFKDEDWSKNFVFDYIKQSYLLAARNIQQAVGQVEGLPPESEKKVAFFTRQYVDALAPSNFLMTNPQVLRETLASGGQNLVRGLNNLLADLERGGGELRISMTDEAAFQLGRNVATSPGKVIFQTELMQLIQYLPITSQVYRRPLVIIPPWINKYYILDLREKNSFIRWAVEQGHTVFVLSWVNPDARLAQKGFEDYMMDHRLLPRRHAAWRDARLPRGEERRPGEERDLLRQPARLLTAGRARRLHRRAVGRQPRAQDERARLSRGVGDGEHVQPDARQ